MKIYDITPPVGPTLPVWEGDPPPRMTLVSQLAQGDLCDVTALTMGAHTGAHVDAPAHFLAGGATVEALDLDVLVGPALVADLRGHAQITAAVLASLQLPSDLQRLLMLTDNSSRRLMTNPQFQRDYVGLTSDAAAWLVDHGLRLVGIDYLSIAAYDEAEPVHRKLLQNNMVIVEGLDLVGVPPGGYELYCLPLKLPGSEGAPLRAILRAY